MTLRTRVLPTPYDPPSGVLTVATPSCGGCCCCCCCLNAVGAGATVAAAVAHGTAVRNGRPTALPTLLGLSTVVAAGLVAWLVARGQVEDAITPPLAAAIAAYGLVATVALRRAGARLLTAALAALGLAAGTALLFAIELPLTLATELWLELATPFSVWGGWVLGKALIANRDGAPPTDDGGSHGDAYAPPSSGDAS
jgi:hypothetical protein